MAVPSQRTYPVGATVTDQGRIVPVGIDPVKFEPSP